MFKMSFISKSSTVHDFILSGPCMSISGLGVQLPRYQDPSFICSLETTPGTESRSYTVYMPKNWSNQCFYNCWNTGRSHKTKWQRLVIAVSNFFSMKLVTMITYCKTVVAKLVFFLVLSMLVVSKKLLRKFMLLQKLRVTQVLVN